MAINNYNSFNIKFIILSRKNLLKKYKNMYFDKKDDRFILDILLGIIFEYFNDCSLEECVYHIKNDYDIDITEKQIDTLYRYHLMKRYYSNTQGIFVIDTKKFMESPDYLEMCEKYSTSLFIYRDLFFCNNEDLIDYSIFWNGTIISNKHSDKKKRKVKIGNCASLVTLKNLKGEVINVSDVLIVKRFSYAYQISDFAIINSYGIKNGVNFTPNECNEFVINSQLNFYNSFNIVSDFFK